MELLARFNADQDAVGEVYARADDYLPAFRANHPSSSTPWPFALFEWDPEHEAPLVVRTALRWVRDNTSRLKEIVDEKGWPGRDLAGEEGADAAWLLLQHAGSAVSTIDTPDNRAFRRACVPLLRRAVMSGLAHPRHLAHTVDGIRSVENEPPAYAVLSSDYQVRDGLVVFRWPVDQAVIDRNRSEIGLRPLVSDVALRERGREVPVLARDGAEPWPQMTF